jgi:hypothetical protein
MDLPKTPESSTKPKLAEQPKLTSVQPPVHPFADVYEVPYQPPYEWNFAATPAKPAKDKELAYHTTTPIQNPKIMTEVYNKLMNLLLVTLSTFLQMFRINSMKQSPQNKYQMNPYQPILW